MKRTRVFPANTAISISGPASSSQDMDTSSGNQPLAGMKFVLLGKLYKTNPDLSKSITSLGGKISSKVEKMTTACIGTGGKIYCESAFPIIHFITLLLCIIKISIRRLTYLCTLFCWNHI